MTRLTKWATAAILLAGMAAIPAGRAAGAMTYNFNFGTNATGTFTIGAAASDPGFFLVTSFQVLTFTDSALGPVSVSIAATSPGQFAVGAAYDPTTGAFVNHFGGTTFPNLGDIGDTGQGEATTSGTINGDPAFVFGPSFELGSTSLVLDTFPGGKQSAYTASGPLVITSGVPEPSSLALCGIAGATCLVVARARRRVAA